MALDDVFGGTDRDGVDDEPIGSEDDDDRNEPGGPTDYAERYRPPDPEEKYSDPAEELPNVPEPPRPDPEEIPADLRLSFWWLVLVFNGALLALWLGALFVGFEGDWDLGGRLLLVGSVLFAYGYYKYRTNPYR